jgi:hypothetical protein
MTSLSAADLRLWAARCARQAQDAKGDEEVVQLLKMQTGLLELAETQDWFEGKRGGAADADQRA